MLELVQVRGRTKRACFRSNPRIQYLFPHITLWSVWMETQCQPPSPLLAGAKTFSSFAPSECRSSSDSLSSQYAGHFWRCSKTGGVERPAALARGLFARGMYASAEEKADGDRRCDDFMARLRQSQMVAMSRGKIGGVHALALHPHLYSKQMACMAPAP